MSIPSLQELCANTIVTDPDILEQSKQIPLPTSIRELIEKVEIISKWKWLPIPDGQQTREKIILYPRNHQDEAFEYLELIDKIGRFICSVGLIFEDICINHNQEEMVENLSIRLRLIPKNEDPRTFQGLFSSIELAKIALPFNSQSRVIVHIKDPKMICRFLQRTHESQEPICESLQMDYEIQVYEMVHAFVIYYVNQFLIDTDGDNNMLKYRMDNSRFSLARQANTEEEVIKYLFENLPKPVPPQPSLLRRVVRFFW